MNSPMKNESRISKETKKKQKKKCNEIHLWRSKNEVAKTEYLKKESGELAKKKKKNVKWDEKEGKKQNKKKWKMKWKTKNEMKRKNKLNLPTREKKTNSTRPTTRVYTR